MLGFLLFPFKSIPKGIAGNSTEEDMGVSPKKWYMETRNYSPGLPWFNFDPYPYFCIEVGPTVLRSQKETTTTLQINLGLLF